MKRAKHSLSHYKLFSANMGQLIPCGLVEVLPGDTFQHATSVLLRVSPLLAPVMHPVQIKVHHWFVPHRLVWDKWEDFITGGPDGMDDSQFPVTDLTFTPGPGDDPLVGSTGTGAMGSLADYLGCPPGTNNLRVSALPFRAYNLIFNEWYRDQDLVDPLVISKASGVDTTTTKILQHVAWEKDYFTSSRPFQQKGPEVTIPLTGDAPVKGIGVQPGVGASLQTNNMETGASAPQDWTGWASGSAAFRMKQDASNVGYPGIFADLSGVSAVNMFDLRLAMALQRWEEARARWGSRYTEYLRYLGVRSSDARLQRPEYLGGGKQTIQFSEVLQTAPTEDGDDTVGVGNIKGHGIGALRSNRYRRFFEEHGYVISLISVKPRTMYMQGLPRTWNRRTKEDFWQRELEHIGQQEIARKEIYAGAANPDNRWSWQDRYDEYRRMESNVSGEFRSELLNFWHMAREFSAAPDLDGSFVQAVPTDRVYAVPSQNVLWVMANHSIQARRMVSKMGNSFIY